ncbi:MAG: hypothetical protein WAU81_10360 [Candidatus Aminicenantales bacterium]
MRPYLPFVAGAIVTIVLPMSCRRDSPRSKEKDMITVYQSSVDLGDPHICSDSANRLSLIFSVYEALVKMDAAGGRCHIPAQKTMVKDLLTGWLFFL